MVRQFEAWMPGHLLFVVADKSQRDVVRNPVPVGKLLNTANHKRIRDYAITVELTDRAIERMMRYEK